MVASIQNTKQFCELYRLAINFGQIKSSENLCMYV